jgi:hypothetical protein
MTNEEREAQDRERLQAIVAKVTRKAVADGLLIEAGWLGMREMAIPPDAPEIQLEEMRMAFFAGAQHLLGSIMTMLDPGSEEPTPADEIRMGQIADELNRFVEGFKVKYGIELP